VTSPEVVYEQEDRGKRCRSNSLLAASMIFASQVACRVESRRKVGHSFELACHRMLG
jgi:hypothetical protein